MTHVLISTKKENESVKVKKINRFFVDSEDTKNIMQMVILTVLNKIKIKRKYIHILMDIFGTNNS